MSARPLWRGTDEPPLYVWRVREESSGLTAVRAGDVTDRDGTFVPAGTCDYCGRAGTWWTWEHNGASACWLDLDFVGVMVEARW